MLIVSLSQSVNLCNDMHKNHNIVILLIIYWNLIWGHFIRALDVPVLSTTSDYCVRECSSKELQYSHGKPWIWEIGHQYGPSDGRE